MILWKDYLAMLALDGAVRGESEEAALTDDGERIVRQLLIREVQGRTLWIDLEDPIDLNECVPQYLQRQIANRLRLPPERYIFRDL